MKSILRQAQQIFSIKEEFKSLFSKKNNEKKTENKVVVKEKVAQHEEELMEV
ncbi:MAG: hypothetical protein ACOVLC_07865 [Flavobacterium sp.]